MAGMQARGRFPAGRQLLNMALAGQGTEPARKGSTSMSFKRFIVELGYGADLHGGDVTKAARRAVRDAVSRNCLCGLFDILGLEDPDGMHVAIKIGCPRPEEIDAAEVLREIPFGSRELEAVSGGLSVRGLEIPALGEGDHICVAVAALTVSVDVHDAALPAGTGRGEHAP